VHATDDAAVWDELWSVIDRWAKKHRVLTIIVEPDGEAPSAAPRGIALTAGPEPIQPARTVKTLLRDDDGLMAQMHAKTRYNVRMAKRRDVQCRPADHSEDSVAVFYGLLQDTASRNAFAVHEAAYYREFLRLFDDDALLMFAEIEGRVAAGVIAVVFGGEAIYMYGASSTRDRANGAGFLIQYEAMRWARGRGATRYDMWGIPEYDPDSTVSESGDRLASSHGGDWRGIYEFKTRFGGDIVSYPRPIERLYHPLLTSLARRFYNAGGAA
jgi:lipid II:glycine glycyltransferase (peptidoglycan interpeptide bridge formation enzyme)